MDADAIERAAELLCRARMDLVRLAGLPDDCRPADQRDGYAVQAALHRRLEVKDFGPLAGHKIGCTTPVMQRFLGIASPCAGGVLAHTVKPGPISLRHGGFLRVGVECEIAVRLAEDLPARDAPYTRDRVASAVGAVMAAIEVVDDRYLDYRSVDLPTLIADDFFNAGCVLAPSVESWRELDLAALCGRMWINRSEVAQGRGGDVLGHPFEALAWLANSTSLRGCYPRAGEIVLLGSVVETVWVEAGDLVEVEIEGLGHISARFD